MSDTFSIGVLHHVDLQKELLTTLQVIWGLQHINMKIYMDSKLWLKLVGKFCYSLQWDQNFSLLKEIARSSWNFCFVFGRKCSCLLSSKHWIASETIFDLLWFALVKWFTQKLSEKSAFYIKKNGKRGI